MKNLFYLLFVIPFISFSQINEEVKNSKGKVIKTERQSENFKNKTSEEIVTLFYNNQNDINFLNRLISFRFYQETPYLKFKDEIEKRNKKYGMFKSKKLLDQKKSQDGNMILYQYEIHYERKTTIEEIGLMKENNQSAFEIVKYVIK